MGTVKVKILILALIWVVGASVKNPSDSPVNAKQVFLNFTESFYDCVKEERISYNALQYGLRGYHYLRKSAKLKKKRYLTIVDFSLPSNKERLFIIDIELNKVIHRSLVSHGMETGRLEAMEFSNEHNSHKSSLGFYITGRVYKGKHDESIKLYGLERNFNDNAYNRGVVVHRADYATESFLKSNNNVLGRSLGCPAVPFEDYTSLVNIIRDGSCFFIYSPNKEYLRKSKIVNSQKAYDNFLEHYNS